MENQDKFLEKKKKEVLMEKFGNFWMFFAGGDMAIAKRKDLAYQKFEEEYPGICLSLRKKIMNIMTKKGAISPRVDLVDLAYDFENAFEKMSKYTDDPDILLR